MKDDPAWEIIFSPRKSSRERQAAHFLMAKDMNRHLTKVSISKWLINTGEACSILIISKMQAKATMTHCCTRSRMTKMKGKKTQIIPTVTDDVEQVVEHCWQRVNWHPHCVKLLSRIY